MSKIYFNDKGVITEDDGQGTDEVEFNLPIKYIQKQELRGQVVFGTGSLPQNIRAVASGFTDFTTAVIMSKDIDDMQQSLASPRVFSTPSFSPEVLLVYSKVTGTLAGDTARAVASFVSSVQPTISSSTFFNTINVQSIATGSGPGFTSGLRAGNFIVNQISNRPITIAQGLGAFVQMQAGSTDYAPGTIGNATGFNCGVTNSSTGSITNVYVLRQNAVTNTGGGSITNIAGYSSFEPADGVGTNVANLVLGKQTFNVFPYTGNWSIYNFSTRPNFQASKTCFDSTDASATPGSVTINKPSGIVAIAAGNAGVTVTNSYVTASSIVIPTLRTNDNTLVAIRSVLVGSGSFTISGSANATATTVVSFVVYN